MYFGKNRRFRFDAPRGEYGVCYVGRSPAAAFIETFGQATGNRFVQTLELGSRGLAIIDSTRALRLVDLRGAGLARIGADERLCSGPHVISRRWSAALYHNRDKPDGILYRTRHDPSQASAALFDRAAKVLRLRKTVNLLDPGFEFALTRLLERYEFGLVS